MIRRFPVMTDERTALQGGRLLDRAPHISEKRGIIRGLHTVIDIVQSTVGGNNRQGRGDARSEPGMTMRVRSPLYK